MPLYSTCTPLDMAETQIRTEETFKKEENRCEKGRAHGEVYMYLRNWYSMHVLVQSIYMYTLNGNIRCLNVGGPCDPAGIPAATQACSKPHCAMHIALENVSSSKRHYATVAWSASAATENLSQNNNN